MRIKKTARKISLLERLKTRGNPCKFKSCRLLPRKKGAFESQAKPRQAKTRQDKTRQDKTRQDKTRQDKTRRHDTTRQDTTRHGKLS